jgi:hypothetical protein
VFEVLSMRPTDRSKAVSTSVFACVVLEVAFE